MSWNEILNYFITAVVAAVSGAVIAYVKKELKKTLTDTVAVKAGVQALLRAQLIDDYNHYSEKGFAPIYAKENFENCWQQYHNLGANGVMNDLYEKFMDLPINNSKEN